MDRRQLLDDMQWDNEVLFEAPQDTDGTGDADLQATDYGDMEDVDVEEVGDEDLGAEDYTDTDENEEPVDGEEETDTPPEDNMDGADGEDNPEDTGEENPDENPVEEQPDNTDETMKNEYLIGDFIELYSRLDGIIERVNIHKNTKGIRSPLLVQAKDNMLKVRNVLYDYIVDRFNKETYIANLYQFNLLIQAINVNMELLEKGIVPESDIKGKKSKKSR